MPTQLPKRLFPKFKILAIPASVLVLDRLTKTWFVYKPNQAFWLNTDMSFSLPLWPWLYYPAVVIAIVALAWAAIWHWSQQHWLTATCASTILAAALSNILDRWLYGGVVDFISVPTGGVFNLADVAIVIAVCVWIFIAPRYERV